MSSNQTELLSDLVILLLLHAVEVIQAISAIKKCERSRTSRSLHQPDDDKVATGRAAMVCAPYHSTDADLSPSPRANQHLALYHYPSAFPASCDTISKKDICCHTSIRYHGFEGEEECDCQGKSQTRPLVESGNRVSTCPMRRAVQGSIS